MRTCPVPCASRMALLAPKVVSGRMRAENVTLDGDPLGRVEVLLRPEAGKSAFELNALLEGTRVIGFGTLGYDGDYLLEGKLAVPRLPLRLIRTLVSPPPRPGVTPEPLPVRGFIEGEASFHLPLARPEALTRDSLDFERAGPAHARSTERYADRSQRSHASQLRAHRGRTGPERTPNQTREVHCTPDRSEFGRRLRFQFPHSLGPAGYRLSRSRVGREFPARLAGPPVPLSWTQSCAAPRRTRS